MALPQPLHIFRKDVIHLWPETLVTLILFVAFAWSAPSRDAGSDFAPFLGILSGLLHLLMPIAWLVVISRLIHDEPLVGDRQFWTSRPYHWAKLLAAKLLYLLVFLYLPFFLMQVYLLKHAGLYPTTAIPALLHNLLLLTVIIVIPLTAIAAVTSTFARLLLSVLGGIIYLLILSALVVYLAFRQMPPPALQPILTTLFILLPAVALVYQYATRRTSIARILLIATPLLILLLLVIVPTNALIHHAYPVAGSDAPKLTAVPQPPVPQTGKLRLIQNQVQILLPVAASGIDPQSNYIVQGAAVTLDAPGLHWSSPYLNAFGQQINAFSPGSVVPFPLSLKMYNKIHNTPVDVHLSLATDRLKLGTPTTWKATQQPFSVPGHGVCSFSAEEPNDPPVCRFPLAIPEDTFVSASLSAGPCNTPGARSVVRQMSLRSPLNLPTLDFDPVLSAPLGFSARDAGPQEHLSLCPGTGLQFVEAKSQGKTRLEADQKQVLLDAYAARLPDPSQHSDAPQLSR